ncbi:hypothetical protein SLS55_001906 [Diplodia seriata]|uniref:Uncharacterized protein n=1 Tax=Diplodia seriata TaxID=420778 RepID=A0ABR3CQM4_9PEZI
MTTSYASGKQVDGRTVQPAATKSTHPGLSVMRPICAARKTLGYKNLLVRYSSDVDDPEKYAIRAEPTPNALRRRTNIGVPPQVTRLFADALVMSFAVGCGMGILESIALIISGTWPGLIVGSAFLPLGGFPASNYIM